MTLKYELKTVFSVYFNDWDNFVQHVYGNKEYEIACVEETLNNTVKEYDVSKKELSEYETKELNSFKAGIFANWITGILIQDMVNNDILQPGTYSINISW